MKIRYCFIFIIITLSCNNTDVRITTKTKEKAKNGKVTATTPKQEDKRIGKVEFYLENSGSMFGYVKGYTEYVSVVSELAHKPKFADENTNREFYFVNGGDKGTEIDVKKIGQNPDVLEGKLNRKGFNRGHPSGSNLNLMFRRALSRARNDTISILISDGIYDVGCPEAPMNILAIKGKETRSHFIKKLKEGDIETILIKLGSQFKGRYYRVTGKSEKLLPSLPLSQKRPYYIWIFGRTELLNEYFSQDYIKSLKGYTDDVRFLIANKFKPPYQISAYNKIGSFQFDRKNKNKLKDVNRDRNGKGFQFTIATDFSTLPFPDSYLNSPSNYSCSNINFSIKKVTNIGGVRLYGLDFSPTHLITVYTDRNPVGRLDISLLNTPPNWIKETNIDNEVNIVDDTTHTVGFRFLINAISEAYQYKNQGKSIAKFNIELVK